MGYAVVLAVRARNEGPKKGSTRSPGDHECRAARQRLPSTLSESDSVTQEAKTVPRFRGARAQRRSVQVLLVRCGVAEWCVPLAVVRLVRRDERGLRLGGQMAEYGPATTLVHRVIDQACTMTIDEAAKHLEP